jgi:hypothetical protein
LSGETIERMVAEYVSGRPTTKLSKEFGIGKGTLLRLLADRGVPIRHAHRKFPLGD